MTTLATRCPCGHTANFHATQAESKIYQIATGGRYSMPCQGAPFGTGHCHCITYREEVISAGES